MKKIIAALLLVPALAFAGAGSQLGETTPTTQINLSQYPRVLMFPSDWNAISNSGEMLICRAPNKGSWRDECTTPDGKNGWMRATDLVIPGFELAAYEYRFSGSGGYRHLFLYFSKKQ